MRIITLAILITVISIAVYAQPGTQITQLNPYIPWYTLCHTETEMTISHYWHYYAMRIFNGQNVVDDPVFHFYTITNSAGRTMNCPFYRPYEGYNTLPGKELNCFRINSNGKF